MPPEHRDQNKATEKFQRTVDKLNSNTDLRGLEKELVGRLNTFLHTDDYSKENHFVNEKGCPRATLHRAALILNGPFPPKLHKKFPKCVSIPGTFMFVYPKNYHFKTALHL